MRIGLLDFCVVCLAVLSVHSVHAAGAAYTLPTAYTAPAVLAVGDSTVVIKEKIKVKEKRRVRDTTEATADSTLVIKDKAKRRVRDTTEALAPVSVQGPVPGLVPAQAPAAANKAKAAPTDAGSEVGTLSAAWAPVEIKHSIGFRAGYGMGYGRFEPTRENQLHLGLLNGALVYLFDVPAQKYVGAIQIELGVMQKGYSYLLYKESVDVISRDYTVIEIPVLWQPYLPLSRKNGSRFYLNAGPYVSYTLGGTFRDYNKETGVTAREGQYEYKPLRDNRWEYGIAAGAGFRVYMGQRVAFTFEYRYNIAMSDILKGVEKYPSNIFFRSPIDQMNISIGLLFKLN